MGATTTNQSPEKQTHQAVVLNVCDEGHIGITVHPSESIHFLFATIHNIGDSTEEVAVSTALIDYVHHRLNGKGECNDDLVDLARASLEKLYGKFSLCIETDLFGSHHVMAVDENASKSTLLSYHYHPMTDNAALANISLQTAQVIGGKYNVSVSARGMLP